MDEQRPKIVQSQALTELQATAIRLSSRARAIRQGTDEALAAERKALEAWRTYLAAKASPGAAAPLKASPGATVPLKKTKP